MVLLYSKRNPKTSREGCELALHGSSQSKQRESACVAAAAAADFSLQTAVRRSGDLESNAGCSQKCTGDSKLRTH